MSLTEIGNYSSIIGLLISLITMIIVLFVKNRVRNIQYSNLFDRTINKHLNNIDKLQNEINSILPDIEKNEVRLKEIIVELMTEFESLSPKLQKRKDRQKINRLINSLKNLKDKVFYNSNNEKINFWKRIQLAFSNKVSDRDILDIYISINENYRRIIHIKINKKALIK